MTNSNEISVVKDVFTNTPHVIAVSDSGGVKVKALTEYGQSIINEYGNGSEYADWSTPDGFVKTEFKQLTPQMKQVFDSAFSEIGWTNTKINEIATKTLSHQKVKSFLNRTSSSKSKNSFRNPSSSSLRKFRDKANKINILNYKAKTFKDNATTSSLVEKVKSHELAFDAINNIVSSRENSPFASQKLESIISNTKNTRLLRRGIGIKNIEDASTLKKVSRRAARRASNISSKQDDKSEVLSGTQKIRGSIKSKFFNRKRFSK